MDSWNSALEMAGEAFENNVERIIDKFDEAMGHLEEKMNWFDKLQAQNEIFYKDYEKTYEISKLNRQISESIDNTDNVKAQRALHDI
jgi:dsDNA-specific endonuclease/ATPase MutS2